MPVAAVAVAGVAIRAAAEIGTTVAIVAATSANTPPGLIKQQPQFAPVTGVPLEGASSLFGWSTMPHRLVSLEKSATPPTPRKC
jgi:phosphoribosylcarboxyaminoimidazole (NCAIR) mutase